jgi:hypothetical protein
LGGSRATGGKPTFMEPPKAGGDLPRSAVYVVSSASLPSTSGFALRKRLKVIAPSGSVITE